MGTFVSDPASTLFADKVATKVLPLNADLTRLLRAADINAIKGALLDLRTALLNGGGGGGGETPAPSAPTITSPADGAVVGSSVTLQGTGGGLGLTLLIYRDDVEIATQELVGNSWSVTVPTV